MQSAALTLTLVDQGILVIERRYEYLLKRLIYEGILICPDSVILSFRSDYCSTLSSTAFILHISLFVVIFKDEVCLATLKRELHSAGVPRSC